MGQGGDEAWGDGFELILVPTDIWKYWLGYLKVFQGVLSLMQCCITLYLDKSVE